VRRSALPSIKGKPTTMIEVRAATVDEMILAFLQADIETPAEDRKELYGNALAVLDKSALIDRGDLTDPQQNNARRRILGEVRGALFQGFPGDTDWRLFKVTPDQLKGFRYVNHLPNWSTLSGGTRLVGDAVKNLDKVQNAKINSNVTGIATRLRQGDRFPALIAAQLTGADELVLIEGHNRATAYALAGLPDEIEMFIGKSPQMHCWPFY
jgi:hypothetical protein